MRHLAGLTDIENQSSMVQPAAGRSILGAVCSISVFNSKKDASVCRYLNHGGISEAESTISVGGINFELQKRIFR